METVERDETKLVIDGFEPCSSINLCQCRICHEEEDAESTEMESPCGCSGSLKFAHRGCIQRWCDEKGSTVCEICLQKFEPGYTIPPKVHLVDVVVTIRGSLEVPRLNYEPHSADSDDDLSDYEDPECSPSMERGKASFYRSVALMVTVMLLVRHLFAMITVGADQYAFALATVFLLRATGILLPFYLVMRMVAAIQHAQWQERRRMRFHLPSRERNGFVTEGEEDVEMQSHRIQIQS